VATPEEKASNQISQSPLPPDWKKKRNLYKTPGKKKRDDGLDSQEGGMYQPGRENGSKPLISL